MKDRNQINQDGLLRWFLTAILVLGLISFAGSLSESGLARIERTRTELRAASRIHPGNTVHFKTACCAFTAPFWQIFSQTSDFTSYLLEFGSNIEVKIKSSNTILRTVKLQVRRFVKHYSHAHSGDRYTERIRG
jgi:hypothetical protein